MAPRPRLRSRLLTSQNCSLYRSWPGLVNFHIYILPVVGVSDKPRKVALRPSVLFFFFTLVTGPRRSLGLQLSDTRVYEPQIRDAPWGAGLISKQKRVMIIHPLCASYSTSEKHGVRNTDEGQQNLLLGITVQGFLAHKKALTP